MANIDNKYIYSELSHEIIGACYLVQNNLGPNYKEKTYEDCLAKEFDILKIKYERQVSSNITLNNKYRTKRIFDFIIDDKILVEIKAGNYFAKQDFTQIKEYLKITNLKLGLLVLFTGSKVRIKRIPNLQ